jgi:pimeloyl-ACP methyl ester carboxylesterase
MSKRKEGLALFLVVILIIVGSLIKTTNNRSWTLEDFNSQELNWRDCYGDFQCSTFKVPVDYKHIDKKTFTLSVLRHQALDQKNRLGAILVNPGGPGGSATDYAYNADLIVSKAIYEKFDIVGFDPRGINTSEPIRCLTNIEEDKYLEADVSAEKSKRIAGVVAISKGFAAKCAKAAGTKLGHYSTFEGAKDMEVLRNLLHEKRLNYLGKSYGTYLGTLYAALYPKSVGKMVLDGAVAPNVSLLDQGLAQSIGFESALKNYLVTNKKIDIEDIKKLLARSLTSPMKGKKGRLATQSLVITAIAQSLYDPKHGWKELTDALELALGKEDPTGILALADSYNNRDSSGNYYSNQTDISVIISCLDWQESRTISEIAADQGKFEKASPIFGPYLGLSSLSCKFWKAKPVLPNIDLNKIDTNPVLIIGVTQDPATPYKWAKALAKIFTKVELVTLKGEGHTGHNRGNACVDTAVDSYFLTGKIGPKGLICT